MKKLLLPIAVVIAVLLYQKWDASRYETEAGGTVGATQSEARDDAVAEAYASQQSGVQVTGEGRVTRILDDDNEGDRHQRFILRLDSGQTVLVAHNVDLAPRLDALEVGDVVAFSGEYEWNDRGGLVHWTHHDPQGQHADGWLKHRGRTYR